MDRKTLDEKFKVFIPYIQAHLRKSVFNPETSSTDLQNICKEKVTQASLQAALEERNIPWESSVQQN